MCQLPSSPNKRLVGCLLNIVSTTTTAKAGSRRAKRHRLLTIMVLAGCSNKNSGIEFVSYKDFYGRSL